MGDSSALVRISSSDGMFHVVVESRGDDADAAKGMASLVLEWLAAGKEAFIRSEPSGDEQQNLATGKADAKGFARFSFMDKAGKWHVRKPTDEAVVYYGLGDEK